MPSAMQGVDLLVLGAVQHAAGGCACPESVLLKSLVSHLVLRHGDVVILDMEAGIEHLGRGTAMGVDLMLVVVEPGQRSVETAARVRQMVGRPGHWPLRRGAEQDRRSRRRQPLDRRANSATSSLLGVIPLDARIARADRQGLALLDLGCPELLNPFRSLQKTLQSYCTEKESVL